MGVNGIYGLSGSGLDIESMVKVGMMSKQSEYDKMAQKYTKNEWTKTALVELNNQINTFNMSTLINYKLSSNTNARTASSTNEAAVTATATAKALAMPHRVDVEELSSNAYLISKNTLSKILTDNGYSSSDEVSLKNLFLKSTFTNAPVVKSEYASQNITSSTPETTYKGATGSKLLTETTLNRDNNGTITSIDYKEAGATSATNHSVNSRTTTGTTNVTFSDSLTATIERTSNTNYTISVGGTNYNNATATIDPNDSNKTIINSNKSSTNNTDGSTTTVNATAVTDSSNQQTSITVTNTKAYAGGTATVDGDTTTIAFNKTDSEGNVTLTTNASITEVTNNTDPVVTTYNISIGDKSYTGLTKDANGNYVLNNADGSTTTITLSDTTDESGNTVKSLSIEDKKEYTGSANNTFSKQKEVLNADKLTVTVETTTDTSGNKTSTVKTESQESGYFGQTLGGNSISSGFSSGVSASIAKIGSSDAAVSFSIGDGVNGSINISYTFDELFNGRTGSDGTSKTLTITDLVSDINTKAKEQGLNITATYEFLSDRFFLYNSESGADNQIIITAADQKITDGNYNAGTIAKEFFNTLGLSQSKDGGLTMIDGSNPTISAVGKSIEAAGSYAKARVDGVLYDKIENNKLEIEALGITYDLHNVTSTKNADGSIQADNPVTVTIGQDVEKIVDNVKSFVENYNKILSSLYEKYDEKPESGYTPLTQSQKDQMKDEQVEKWEEKAKKGLLYHDSTLSKIISDMRNAITASVEVDDKKYSVFSIGIGTTGIKGQLTLDEDKLRKAISEDSEAVYNTLSKLTMTTDRTGKEVTDYEKSGVAQRLGDVFTNATKLLKSRAGSSNDITEDSDLNNLLRELQTKMSNFKKMMSAFEDKLYKKYDAMEVALSKLGMQLNFITGGQ